jgi:hypothetical protein
VATGAAITVSKSVAGAALAAAAAIAQGGCASNPASVIGAGRGTPSAATTTAIGAVGTATGTSSTAAASSSASAACVVEGYPGAAVTDTPGHVVLNATRAPAGFMSEGTYPAPHPITLAPGAVVATLLEWIDVPLHGETPVGANCPGMDGGKLLTGAASPLRIRQGSHTFAVYGNPDE